MVASRERKEVSTQNASVRFCHRIVPGQAERSDRVCWKRRHIDQRQRRLAAIVAHPSVGAHALHTVDKVRSDRGSKRKGPQPPAGNWGPAYFSCSSGQKQSAASACRSWQNRPTPHRLRIYLAHRFLQESSWHASPIPSRHSGLRLECLPI